MRHRNKVVAVASRDDGVTVTVETPDGRYDLEADWLVACDGVRSPAGTCSACRIPARCSTTSS